MPSSTTLTAGVLTRHQPKPGAHLAAVLELTPITYRRDHSRRHQRTDTFDFNQPPKPFVLLANVRDPLVVLPQTVVEHTQPLGQLAQQLAHQRTQALVFQDQGKAACSRAIACATTMPRSRNSPLI